MLGYLASEQSGTLEIGFFFNEKFMFKNNVIYKILTLFILNYFLIGCGQRGPLELPPQMTISTMNSTANQF